MKKENKQFGDRFNTWYHENHDNKLDELPDYFNRTPESEVKYKLLIGCVLVLGIIGLGIFIYCQAFL